MFPGEYGTLIAKKLFSPGATTWGACKSDGTVQAYTTTTAITPFGVVAGVRPVVLMARAVTNGSADGSYAWLDISQVLGYNPASDAGAFPISGSGQWLIIPAADMTNVHIRATSGTDRIFVAVYG